MRAPGFWWRAERGLPARLLAPLGALAGAVAAARLCRPGTDAGVPVLCVGNPTVGGSGKTPTALYLAARLIADGHRVAFLTRGYGGRLRGPLSVDPERHRTEEVGDEALLLARAAPTFLARDRVAGAQAAAAAGADLIVMDDGFQNPSLAKSLSLLVIDAAVGVGNGLCLPAGPLRAPLHPQLTRAHALLLVGEGRPGEQVARAAAAAGLPVLRGWLAPQRQAAARLAGQKLLAFAGIGRPEKFFATLRGIGADPAQAVAFPDHHRFTEAEAEALLVRAEQAGLTPATTEKDAVRLAAHPAGRRLLAVTQVLPVRLALDAPSEARLADVLVRLGV